jgi:hypothetical protein
VKLEEVKKDLKGILNNPYVSKFSNDLTENEETEEDDDDLSFVSDDPENYIDVEGEDSEEINARDEEMAMGDTGFDLDKSEVVETPLEDGDMEMGMESEMSNDPIQNLNDKIDNLIDKISSIEAMISGETEEENDEEEETEEDSEDEFEDEEEDSWEDEEDSEEEDDEEISF